MYFGIIIFSLSIALLFGEPFGLLALGLGAIAIEIFKEYVRRL
jgi:protein-S-isoprenylcysteine O-methyltransferase Ste14